MTIKELAEQLGVSKTAIRKKMDENFRKEYTYLTENRVIEITENGCEKLSQSFRKPLKTDSEKLPKTETETTNTADKELIEFLKAEIEIKNKQIDALTTALTNAQMLQANAEQQIKLLSAPKKHWWQRKKENE